MAFASRAISRRTWQELFGTRNFANFYAWRCTSSGPIQQCGAESSWQVSSRGRVCNSRGEVSYGCLQPSGYFRVNMSGNNFYVHRLVALAFLGPPPDDLTWQVHHHDGNKANNRLDNLEYVTPSQNNIASYASQTRRCGGDKQSIPVMWRAVESQTWTTSPSMKEAAAELGMSLNSVWRGCRCVKAVKGYEFQLADSQGTGALEGEDWRQMYDPVSGLKVPGRMVSSRGRIKSRNGLISLGCLLKSGYYTTSVCLNSHKRLELVHRLVAFAFLGPPPSQHCMYVNHKDLDKSNNAAENLEYVTCSENMAHFFSNTGIRNRMSRPVESRLKSSKEWTKHPSIRSTAAALSISRTSISACISRRLASACGYEFRLATKDILSGEEWRCLDLAALLREKSTRKGR
ncbi:unnamed protein product [Durusdinium trenchii]|uniref:HNH nuclease domain-containing protein n=1 Tax=Durusdinium trenchii TaxID=1381693 RepID=A0ABP0T006_9DINO